MLENPPFSNMRPHKLLCFFLHIQKIGTHVCVPDTQNAPPKAGLNVESNTTILSVMFRFNRVNLLSQALLRPVTGPASMLTVQCRLGLPILAGFIQAF